MSNKITIKETIVVEGKTDINKLLNLFNVNIITTNGSDCNKETLNMIKEINNKSGVILLLDPDYAGERIRKKITNFIPNIKQAFINLDDIPTSSSKKGIAEASNEAIINALQNVVTFSNQIISITLGEFNSLNIDSKKKRIAICNYYKISYCNNKQLLKRLNMMNISFDNLKQFIKNANISE